MSLIKLNLIDSQTLVTGILHAGIGDRLIAALSVEPETICELEAGLSRFELLPQNFVASDAFVHLQPDYQLLDYKPFDAGILIIDLAARIVVSDSIYSQPGPRGKVEYHDGTEATDLLIPYWLDDDWLFLGSVDNYRAVREDRRRQRAANPQLDARPVLYGGALLEFIAVNVLQTSIGETTSAGDEVDPLSDTVTDIHARWLMTPRDDLRGQSPRDVLLAKQDLVNFDQESRALQWSFQLVGPPCISKDTNAYRFAGFGTHEWVLYYDMVRQLIWSALAETNRQVDQPPMVGAVDFETLVKHLSQVQAAWLSEPNDDIGGHIPFILIDNERKRLPEAMGGRSMVIDEDCPCCKMMGDESEAGLGVWFFHLDGCNMDDAFAFSSFRTIAEWEAEQKRREEFDREFERRWKDREERIASGEPLESDSLFDPPALDEFLAVALEPDIPEA